MAIDGRYETVYPAPVANRFLEFYEAKGDWKGLLLEHLPEFILVNSRSKIYSELKQYRTWEEIYSDAGCALFGQVPKLAKNQHEKKT